jgi:hypothetical protein
MGQELSTSLQNIQYTVPSVWVLAFHLPVDIVLKLLHVEELERLVVLQEAVGQLQDVVGQGGLLQGLAGAHLHQSHRLI